jgi:hypothetical protein
MLGRVLAQYKLHEGSANESLWQTFPQRTEGSVKKHWYKVGHATGKAYRAGSDGNSNRTCTTPSLLRTK